MDLDVEIYKDKMVASRDGSSQVFKPLASFSTSRLLVGYFRIAQDCLKTAVRGMGGLGIFRRRTLRLHPMECTEGGLSEVELRVLKELGHGAGAKKVEVILNGQAV